MNVKKLLQLTMLLFFVSIGVGRAQDNPKPECGCQTNAINISTGIHPTSQSPLSAPSFEPSWVLTQSPDPNITTPAIPRVIQPSPVWGQSTPIQKAQLLATASYISPFNTADHMANNPAPQPAFSFRLDFCVCSEDNYVIRGLLNADDEGELYLDGTFIEDCNGWGSVVSVNTTMALAPGTHTLELRLRNTGSQVMGIALSGTITSANGYASLMGYNCCRPVGGINGQKFLDENCNGRLDEEDPIGSGWTFVLNPGNIVVATDVLGTFNFPSLAPGVYTLSEASQPGWNPVLPNTAGAITVNVVAGEVTTIDFLNTPCEIGCEKECYWRTTGNNTIDPEINYLGTNTDAPLIIRTNNIERARIEGVDDGNMGIATSSPTTILHTYAAPPPSGAPSGLRFEELPWGEGYVLVADEEGYVYRSSGWASKGGTKSQELLEMQQQVNDLKKELSELRSVLQGKGENKLTVSPNPTSGQVKADFYISGSYTTASIIVVDNTGKTLLTIPVSGVEGTSNFTIPQTVASGSLLCTLIIDGKPRATQKIVLLNK